MEKLMKDKYYISRDVLDSTTINRILNGPISWNHKLSNTRSQKKTWNGCLNITDGDVKYFGKVKLPCGRMDINLPITLVQEFGLCEKSILRSFPKGFRIASYQLLITPCSDETQTWHQDHGGLGPDDYYTLLIPLVDIPGMGKTKVKIPYTKDFDKHAKTITPDVTIGDGLLFSGSLWHKGTANVSNSPRYCLYLVISNAPSEKLFETWK